MKILLTGATGYIGKRLLPKLIANGHFVVCGVREKSRFLVDDNMRTQVEVIELNTLLPETLKNIPKDIDGAYYLIHSMNSSWKNFDELEAESARNFKEAMNNSGIKHVIYMGGIVNDKNLSKHLKSRKNVEDILHSGNYNFTALRAGIIIGSGSASFEIIRDMVEKLPIMLTPRWVLTKSQPIAIRDVLQYLTLSLFNENTYNQSFDIGGPDVITYKEMLLQYAQVRNLRRRILTIPLMTPRFSSYWLYFVTSTSYILAANLVDSMKVEVICKPNQLAQLFGIEPISYSEAIRLAFTKIEQNDIASSWKDSIIISHIYPRLSQYVQVPEHGCYKDMKKINIKHPELTKDAIWAIGGETGWYYADWLWKFRGFIDRIFGGVGISRGRTNRTAITPGSSLDFWRVILADKEKGRLLLYAEMKIPGEAWLEFNISGNILHQTATFRPWGLSGRLYWLIMKPFHYFIFRKMIERIGR